MSDMENQEEPGLDRHVWESEWESLQEELGDRPAETLPALADLVGEMHRSSGYPIHHPVVGEAVEPEIAAEYREVRRIANLVAEGGDVDPGDVGDAIESLREIYRQLLDGGRLDTV
jgi:hypothetical protein